MSSDWWRDATVYQVYVRSFADSDGDGVGDLDGIRERLGYLELLGVDALWLTPFLSSPMADHGHDACDVDPLYGDLAAFDRLVAEAHHLGIRVTIDLVPDDTFERTLRFWLDRGVDGFRVDVAPGLATPDIHRLTRRVLDEYPGTMAVGEMWVTDSERLAMYSRPDELHLGLNARLMLAGYDAVELRTAIDASLDVAAMAGVRPTWTLSNHDVVREASRYGDGALGTQRARAMALVELGLPGVVYLYNGAELGLPNVSIPEWARHLPSGGQIPGRDGCRVPLPWEGTEPPFGFSPGTQTWLPMPPEWVKLTVEHQLEDADSTLSLYRHAIELRKTHPAFAGTELEWYGAPAGCFAYRRKGAGLTCVLNASEQAVPLPAGEILLASGPLGDRRLPPNTSAWLAQDR